MPAAPDTELIDGKTPPIVDVWSRTAPKYRRRAAIFLAICFMLFAGLCVFMHWLHFATAFDFSWSSYFAPLRFWGPRTQTLNDILRYPISVEHAPVHGVVLGLLVGSIVAVPILVSILYRIKAALPFIAAVLVFAHMPWMSFTLLCGCILASVRPFRMNFRYGSALLGMCPVLIYLYLAAWNVGDQSAVSTTPADRTLMIGPWVLAILSACAMTAAVLLIARIVDFRPGVIAPIIAITFATPAIIFHKYVGRDELDYRVLEARVGPKTASFLAARDAREIVLDYIEHKGVSIGGRERRIFNDVLTAAWQESPSLREFALQAMWRPLMANRAAAYEACNRFIAAHPDSKYIPNVLYIQARTMDTRLDEPELLRNARREVYNDFPHVQSEEIWAALLSKRPNSPLAIAAALRLAQLRLRAGKVDQTLELLAQVDVRGDPAPSAAAATQPALRALLSAPPPESSLEFDSEPYIFEAGRLRELIDANRDDPLYGNKPLIDYAALDPRREHYYDQLLTQAARIPQGLLYDNLIAAWAAGRRDVAERHRVLEACLERFAGADSVPQMLYQLAELEIQSLAESDPDSRANGIRRLRQLAERFPATRWGEKARRRIALLMPASDLAQRPKVPE